MKWVYNFILFPLRISFYYTFIDGSAIGLITAAAFEEVKQIEKILVKFDSDKTPSVDGCIKSRGSIERS
jgi:hypothetical protein